MHNNINTEITGAGGGKGGGGGRPAVEAPNTLTSSATVRIVEVISEGEIEGICGGAKGIYLNGTPLQASDGTYNFTRAGWEYRVGLPDQDYMQGFTSVEAEVAINTPLTATTPVVRTVGAEVDAVRVTIQLPEGLSEQNTSTGDLNGSSVSFVIDQRLSVSGTWVNAQPKTITGKTTSPYEKQFRIARPSGTGAWDVRVYRTSADSTSAALRNDTTVSRITEIQEVKDEVVQYNNTAVVGLLINAESVGNQIPTRAYLLKGLKIKIPSNYNPVTRVYTGIWNGTFQTAWTDNPAWILYDLLTNERYALGEFITESQIDKFSFYDAAVYNDAGIEYDLSGNYITGGVPDGLGGFEPRYTCNIVLASREQALRALQTMAGGMRASLSYVNGLLTVLQDRPSDPVKLISKANVIDGMFNYKGTGLFERHTGANVTFNDRTDRHLQRVTTVDASTTTGAMQAALQSAQDKYGYNPVDVAAYGASTEGQAIRHGRWLLDTELNQTELAQWEMSVNGFDLLPGDVVEVYDEDYTDTVGAGRIVSVTGTTVVLDRQVTLNTGAKIQVLLADGVTIEERDIAESGGTVSTVTVETAFSQAVPEGRDFILTTSVEPRQFKILSLSQSEANIVSVETVQHDPNKYARVEFGVEVPAQVFSNATVTTVNAPTGLTFKESQINDASEGLNGLRRSLTISWVAPSQGVVSSYSFKYRVGLGEWVAVSTTSPSFTIMQAFGGVYSVDVSAISLQGNTGPSTTGSYLVNTSGGGASTLNAPTGLQVIGGGTAFATPDLNIEFTNPLSNASVLDATLRDFEVRVIETAGSTTVRTVYVPAVAATQTQTFSYTYAQNLSDGGPRRSIQIQVRCRDASNNLSNPATATFTNPAPATVSNLTAVGGIGSNKITFTLPTEPDFKGVIVWRGTSAGFTPSANTNAVTPNGGYIFDGSTSYFADNALSDATTYYYKVAAYDQFAKDLSGTGLNISSAVSATTADAPGINKGATLPASAAEGDVFFNTTDDKLYRYTGTAWTAAVQTSDLTGTIGADQIAANAVTADKILANSITAGKIAAATITASQIAAGTITAAQIATDTITADNIAAGAITTNELAANAVTAAKINAGAVEADKIAANAITADKINAGAVTTAKLNAGAVTADKLSVTSLSAVSATIGTLRTASTGARLEISDNVIKVFDASGVKRVQLGNLLL